MYYRNIFVDCTIQKMHYKINKLCYLYFDKYGIMKSGDEKYKEKFAFKQRAMLSFERLRS